jgi:hypothetical protein
MVAFIIKQNGEIKQRFSYKIPFNKRIRRAMIQYARATYGPGATIRKMTTKQKADFILHGSRGFFF